MMKSYINDVLWVFSSGAIEIIKTVKLFGFKVHIDLEFQMELEVDFMLYFVVSKGKKRILYLALDPWINEGHTDYNGNAVTVPKWNRATWITISVGKYTLINK